MSRKSPFNQWSPMAQYAGQEGIVVFGQLNGVCQPTSKRGFAAIGTEDRFETHFLFS